MSAFLLLTNREAKHKVKGRGKQSQRSGEGWDKGYRRKEERKRTLLMEQKGGKNEDMETVGCEQKLSKGEGEKG